MHCRARTLAVLLTLAVIAAVQASPREIPLELPSGKKLTVEVMETDEDRARGVMFRESLPLDRGLLFVFDAPSRHALWMKNCKFPIDMVWLDAAGKVVHVAAEVPPCTKEPCPIYEPDRLALYVVEINAGQARREKVTIGARLEFSLSK